MPNSKLGPDNLPRRVVVVGAGIAGLAAARRVAELAPQAELTLLESAERPGGVLQTERVDGYLIERSADSFITDQPHMLRFCRQIGLAEDLINTDPEARRALIVHRGRLQPIPEGFLLMAPARWLPILTTPLLSPQGKLRLFAERWIARRPPFDPVAEPGREESLAQFVTRRLGREAFERIVQPLVSGIYSADPDRLSIAATLPRFLDMERDHGSLTAGMKARRRGSRNVAAEATSGESGARYSLFMTPRLGMSQLVTAAADALPPGVLRLGAAVVSIDQTEATWRVAVAGEPQPILADALILATPAGVAARLLEGVSPPLAADIARIPMGGCSIVCLGFARSDLPRPLVGSGFVAPAVEQRKILAVSYSSQKFAGRADREHVLIRVFIGGAGNEGLAELTDDELQALARDELQELIGIEAPPRLVRVARWNGAMPQYHTGHLARIDQIERRAADLPRLALAGNAYHGVGIPHCIKSGEAAAERVFDAASR